MKTICSLHFQVSYFRFFADLYDDGIQKRFGKYNGDSFQTWLCYEKSYACIGVYNDAKVDYKADVRKPAVDSFTKLLFVFTKTDIISFWWS